MKGKYRWFKAPFTCVPFSDSDEVQYATCVTRLGVCLIKPENDLVGQLIYVKDFSNPIRVGNAYKVGERVDGGGEAIIQLFYNPVGLFK